MIVPDGVLFGSSKAHAAKLPLIQENESVLYKLRFNEPLTAEDVTALEAIFVAEGSTAEEINAAKEFAQGFGLFVRSLMGLDRGAAKQALASFMDGEAFCRGSDFRPTSGPSKCNGGARLRESRAAKLEAFATPEQPVIPEGYYPENECPFALFSPPEPLFSP